MHQGNVHDRLHVDQPLDPSRPAYGYLNVVALGDGDFHSVMVSAFDRSARMRKVCPGDPPKVAMEPFDSQYLLHITWAANTHDGGRVVYKGKQTLDPDRFQDNLPETARKALEAMPSFAEALRNQRPGRLVYSFEWELSPVVGPPAPPSAWRRPPRRLRASQSRPRNR